jgi:P-type Cu+ transporter
MATGARQTREQQQENMQGQEQPDAQTALALEGMTCASCAMRIEKGLKKLPGIKEASVNFATEQATVIYDPTQTGVVQMVQSVEVLGYVALPIAPRHRSSGDPAPAGVVMEAMQEEEQNRQRQRALHRKLLLLILGILLTLPVVILSMFFLNRFPGENILLLALTTPTWAIVGWEFHRGAINTLRHRSANMDTLISIGSTAAYLMSVVATFLPRLVGATTFYDTTALIITLLFLGRYLEVRAKGQTNEAIRKLIGLQPSTAHVLREGKERDLPIEEVQVGEELIVRPGEKIPVDGTVLSGRS